MVLADLGFRRGLDGCWEIGGLMGHRHEPSGAKENRHKGGFDFAVLTSAVPVLWWAKSAAPGAPVFTVAGSRVLQKIVIDVPRRNVSPENPDGDARGTVTRHRRGRFSPVSQTQC